MDTVLQEDTGTRTRKHPGHFLVNLLTLAVPFFLIELSSDFLIHPQYSFGLVFGIFWSFLLSGICLLVPRRAGQILFGLIYFFMAGWTVAQSGYFQVFGKMMWLTTMFLAGEGAGYMKDILPGFSPLWWICTAGLFTLGILVLCKFPRSGKCLRKRLLYLIPAPAMIICILALPELIFLKDNKVWGTHSEYGQSSSLRATYNTMYDARNCYNICGVFQLTARDLWKNEIYPLTPGYRREIRRQSSEINDYFMRRGDPQDNAYTGLFQGKNVILVLMESMDDWLITQEDTPTIHKMMKEGMNFTSFYSPGYGSVRTLNTEFCMNTGIYLPTTGHYVFDYVGNDFNESIASQLTKNGYTAECFHYNSPAFYSRGVMEPAMGYRNYNSYEDYITDPHDLYNECLLFDIPDLTDLFFRDGPTLNTVITRSAHLSYVYNEVLSHYALGQYPEYRGKYGSEEEDCARVKAKLVDDFFAQLIKELESRGQLQNTVIVGVTDHYTYGYKNMEELYAHSQVTDDLLLEKTPFFIWAPDCPDLEIDKTLNSSDILPTLLNLMGIRSPYRCLGQDAFDERYIGYAIFPNGSWISQGIAVKQSTDGKSDIIQNSDNRSVSPDDLSKMQSICQEYIKISNILLTSNYYS